MKQRDQMHQDYERRSYTLSFPAGLNTDQVLAWVQSISGTLRSAPLRLGGNPTLVFELWATDRGFTHRLKVPWRACGLRHGAASQPRSWHPLQSGGSSTIS